ncbi:MAG: GNAT family N-acetyltransferase [Pseudomonadales bacterium]
MIKIQRFDQTQTLAEQPRLLRLAREVFAEVAPGYVEWRIANMPDLSCFIATHDDEWCGFKCGYALTKRRYYSWFGGVVPTLRGKGIAAELMQAQHNWLQGTDYQVVETHVRQNNLAMVRANQKFGFKIVGRFLKSSQVNLIMQAEIGA